VRVAAIGSIVTGAPRRGPGGSIATFVSVTPARSTTGLLVLLAVLATAPAAAAQSKVFEDFRDDGRIDPCAYSKGELNRARGQLPPDIQQYAPGLGDQLGLPCNRAGGGGAAAGEQEQQAQAPAGGSGPPGARPPRLPAPPRPQARRRTAIDAASPAVSASSGGVPTWLAVLIGLAAALGVGGVLASRYGGFDAETFTRPLRSGLAEAGERAADAFSVVRERLRLGS
jgi:hypothetical protein